MCERSSRKLKFKIHEAILSLPFSAKLMRSQLNATGGKELKIIAIVSHFSTGQTAVIHL